MRKYVYPCVVSSLITVANHPKPIPKVLPMELLAPVCRKLGVRYRDIRGKSRKQEIVLARHIGVLMLYYCYGYSMQEIGKILKKDHTIVITARQILRNSFDTGHKYSKVVEQVAPELLPVLQRENLKSAA